MSPIDGFAVDTHISTTAEVLKAARTSTLDVLPQLVLCMGQVEKKTICQRREPTPWTLLLLPSDGATGVRIERDMEHVGNFLPLLYDQRFSRLTTRHFATLTMYVLNGTCSSPIDVVTTLRDIGT